MFTNKQVFRPNSNGTIHNRPHNNEHCYVQKVVFRKPDESSGNQTNHPGSRRIIFGCYNSGSYLPTIASFNPTSNSWTKLGDLNVGRTHHTGVRSLNSFYIYGGQTKEEMYPNEKCTLTGNSIECTLQENPLDRSVDYLFYI